MRNSNWTMKGHSHGSFFTPKEELSNEKKCCCIFCRAERGAMSKALRNKAWKAQEPRGTRRVEDLNKRDPNGWTWGEGGLSRKRYSCARKASGGVNRFWRRSDTYRAFILVLVVFKVTRALDKSLTQMGASTLRQCEVLLPRPNTNGRTRPRALGTTIQDAGLSVWN
jgi:hypothetical protein